MYTEFSPLERPLPERQVAEFLGVSVFTLQRERKAGRIGFARIGRRICYYPDQVEKYQRCYRVEPCSAHDEKQGDDYIKSQNVRLDCSKVDRSYALTTGLDASQATALALKIFKGAGKHSKKSS
jgi:excisionase family DNA binding protein